MPELRAGRKVVTALFGDLTASTEMASNLDPEDLRETFIARTDVADLLQVP